MPSLRRHVRLSARLLEGGADGHDEIARAACFRRWKLASPGDGPRKGATLPAEFDNRADFRQPGSRRGHSAPAGRGRLRAGRPGARLHRRRRWRRSSPSQDPRGQADPTLEDASLSCRSCRLISGRKPCGACPARRSSRSRGYLDFRTARATGSPGPQSVVKHGDHALLQHRPQIDQQIAAADEIHARERRIFGDVMARKYAAFAHAGLNPVAVFES